MRYRFQSALASLAVLALFLNVFSAEYASFFREHKPLRYYANPVFPIYSLGKYGTQLLDQPPADTAIEKIAHDARIPPEHAGRELIIMVVGETARADRFSLNGYSRETNPLLEKTKNLVSYSQVASCGTSTAVSVPCMFAEEGRKDFNVKSAAYSENALDVLSRAGVSVLWRDNNSDSKGVATRVAYEDFRLPENNPVCDSECRDVGMLDGLQDYIDGQSGDVLIVLHQMGNHGPAYFKRYPPEFEVFTPACRTAELAACSDDEINNAYDNAIRYTDFFLAQVIGLLKVNTPVFETAMLYVGDHGESLGEKGLYLHGMPYMFAPAEQTHVPLIVWRGESSGIQFDSALQLQHAELSHDAVFPSLLTAFEVQSAVLDEAIVLFSVKAASVVN